MVMATNALIPVTDHRPTALEMQGNSVAVEAEGVEIDPGRITDLNRQILKIWMLMELPNTIEISGPGTAITGITNGLSPQGQERLQLGGEIEWIELKLLRRDGGGKKLMALHRKTNRKTSTNTKKPVPKDRSVGQQN